MWANSDESATRGTIDRVEEANALFLREFRGMHDPTYTLSNVTKARSAYGDVDVHHYRGADPDSEPKAMVLLIDAGREVHCVVHPSTEGEMDIALAGLEELLLSVRFLDRT